jgi:hypothetical protein
MTPRVRSGGAQSRPHCSAFSSRRAASPAEGLRSLFRSGPLSC